jgi:twitching motility protein PilT
MAAIDKFLKFMVEQGASDFHATTGAAPSFRIRGSMVPASGGAATPFSSDDVMNLVAEIMPQRNAGEFGESGDTDFAYELEGCGRFRVNVFRQRKGPGCVLRHIPTKLMTIEELGLPDAVTQLCALSKGLVLVTGPTGSGKSTTLAAMVDHINRTRRDHIITIEDPIEFVHENQGCLVNQREVPYHTTSFAKALRAALREDPDIVLVGEMRDLETTETAITTAETGHLVLGTLHTTTAASTVDRIIDQFPSDRQAQVRAMLSISLRGVIAQTLLKRADGKGRVAAFEVLVMTPAISNHIREGKTYQIPSAIQTGGKLGMRMLNDDLVRLVKQRLVEPEEAYHKAVDKQDMAVKLRTAGFQVG